VSTWVIASLAFRETIRRKALFGAIALTLGFLVLFGIGSYYAIEDMRGITANRDEYLGLAIGEILLAGLYGVANIGALLAIFVAAGAIATEIEEGTLQAVLARPLGRAQVVLGKWIGFSLMIAAYVAITGLAACLTMYAISGYLSPNVVPGLALLALKAVLLLALALLFSTFLPSLASGIIVFILYAVANVAGMVEQFGRLIQNQTMIDIGVITSLVIPSDALWKMAAALLQPPIPSTLGMLRGAAGPFSVFTPPSVWMGVYSVVYLAAALGIAIWIFRRRDL
jgi:ABC-type transport system involved in multi-copper enzyme maturation permease subunit